MDNKAKAAHFSSVFDDQSSAPKPGGARRIPPEIPSALSPVMRTPTSNHPLASTSPPSSTSPSQYNSINLNTSVNTSTGSSLNLSQRGSSLGLRPGTKPFGSRASASFDNDVSQNLSEMTTSMSYPSNMDSFGGAAADNHMGRSASTPMMTDSEIDSVTPDGSNKLRMTSDDVSADEAGIRKLMQAGAWRSVLRIADRCIAMSNNAQHIMQFKLCRVIALVKTRAYKNALDEITGIGDFNDPVNCYETYPQLAPKKGSMVPFSMKVLKAELTYLVNSDQPLDPLYNLLSSCRREIERLKGEYPEAAGLPEQLGNPSSTPVAIEEVTNTGSSSGNLSVSVWFRREARLMYQIATYLMQQKEYLLAISMVEELGMKYSKDPLVYSCLGRMHLQMGNIRAANLVFKRAEQLTSDPDKSSLCLMNRGYLSLSLDQYKTAIEQFQSVLDLQPSNAAAANNRAICYLYATDLSQAISSLEDALNRDPENNLDESLVFNLSTLYDLAAERSTERKKTMMALVSKYAPDSFDFRVMKINT